MEKIASLHDGTCPRDLLQGLVSGTSRRGTTPLVCADLYGVANYKNESTRELVVTSCQRDFLLFLFSR